MLSTGPIRNTQILVFTLVALLFAFATGAFSQNEATLTADRMNYNPDTREITVEGNVHFQRPDGELFGDWGRGSADGSDFDMQGNVRGNFTQESINIVCRFIRLETEGSNPPRRKIIASGDVTLTRSNDKLTAQRVTWELDRENYKATGKVLSNFGQHSIDADEVARNGEQFWARTVRKYEDKGRKLTLSSSKASGLIRRGDVVELIAEGRLVVNMIDNNGNATRITGNRGVFSKDRGTVVVSGNAVATQDGRNLQAESIVYHIEGGRLDAIGRPSLTIDNIEDR